MHNENIYKDLLSIKYSVDGANLLIDFIEGFKVGSKEREHIMQTLAFLGSKRSNESCNS